MMLRPALLLVATTLLAAGSARADAPAVPPAGPPLSTHPIPSSTPASAPEPPQQRLSLQDRTHAFMMPTGNVLRAGQAAIRSHGILVFNQLAYGLSDNIEVSVGAPISPPMASAGIRAQLMPRSSSLRLLVTGGLWTVFEDIEPSSAFSASATLAYQTSSLNLHVTLGALWPFDDGYEDSAEDMVALTSTGAVLGSDRYAFFIEVGRIGPPGSDEVITGAMLGIKIMGKYLETDLGMMAGSLERNYIDLIPFLTGTYRF